MDSSSPEIRKIEDVTKCQVTFSKRRSSLVRKANEISIFCDVDVALVAFSPSGRVSKFFSRERIEDVLERYVKLPTDKRYQHVRCLEWKLQKMKQLDYIKGDENKLFHLENQIKNLELQIKKTTIELEILQTNLKDFELENEENASLAQILWCEKNLKNTLHAIKDKKKRLLDEKYPSLGQTRPQRSQGHTPFSYNFTGNQVLNQDRQNLTSSSRSLMQHHDPRTCPYSSRVHKGLLDQLYQPRGMPVGVPGASSRFGFNPVAASFPTLYHPGHPYLTQQIAIPPAYSPIQQQAFYWDQTAPSIQNLQFGVFGNSSTHQPVMGSSAIHFVPYQPLGALGTSNLYQPMMTGILDQQLGLGGLGSSSMQLLREDNITPGIPNRQLDALGDSFLDQSFMGDGTTSSVQFQAQQQGVLGSASVANDEPFGSLENQTPSSYHNHNSQNDASVLLPPTSQLQVDPNEVSFNLLSSPNYKTAQNLNVTPPLNPQRAPSEPFFTNNIGSISTPTHDDNINRGNLDNGSTNYCNNNIGNCVANQKHPADPTEENPPPESPTDLIFLSSVLDEAAMEDYTSQSAGKEEESSSMEWDGFALAENLNLEDFDILF